MGPMVMSGLLTVRSKAGFLAARKSQAACSASFLTCGSLYSWTELISSIVLPHVSNAFQLLDADHTHEQLDLSYLSSHRRR